MRLRHVFSAAITFSLIANIAAAGSFGPLDKTSKLGGSPPKHTKVALDCDGHIDVAIGETYPGTNIGVTNNVTTYGCSDWSESGGEVVHHLLLSTPTLFRAEITSGECDLDIALLSACDAANACLIVADSGVYTTAPVSGELWIVIDGYNGASCDFTLTLKELTAPPPACEIVLPTPCDSTEVRGNTCGAENLVNALECSSWPADGADDWRSYVLGPSGSLDATVTMPTGDVVLWLLGTCASPHVCLDYADSAVDGEAESISYTNTTGSNQEVYLVIDSFGAGSCEAYEGQVICTGGLTPLETTSWGNVKAIYR